MKAYEIHLTFDPDNASNVDAVAVGIPGPECADAMAWLANVGKVVSDEKTKEFFDAAKVAQTVSARGQALPATRIDPRKVRR